VLLGAVITGVGHGVAFLHAQDELNSPVPADRRGEVSAAFVCVVYLPVGGSVIAIGLLEEVRGLGLGVGAVGALLTLGATMLAGWQLTRVRRPPA
jgi:hypothetical protein